MKRYFFFLNINSKNLFIWALYIGSIVFVTANFAIVLDFIKMRATVHKLSRHKQADKLTTK